MVLDLDPFLVGLLRDFPLSRIFHASVSSSANKTREDDRFTHLLVELVARSCFSVALDGHIVSLRTVDKVDEMALEIYDAVNRHVLID